jgi:hypothetical protein
MVGLCKQNLRYKNDCFNKTTVDKYDRLKKIKNKKEKRNKKNMRIKKSNKKIKKTYLDNIELRIDNLIYDAF